MRLIVAAALLGALPIVFGATGASARQARLRVGDAAVYPMQSFATGATPATKRLSVTVAMQPRNATALKQFAAAVSTPGNPQYGRFLTVPQFARRFGAAPTHIAAVTKVLRASGLSVSKALRNNLQIQVTGTVGQFEKTFGVFEQQVRLPNGRVAYANSAAPTLPASVAPYVQGVLGLDDVTPDEPAGLARSASPPAVARGLRPALRRPHYPTNGGPQPGCSGAKALQSGGGAGEHGLTADQVATAYQFSGLYGQGDLGQGQTVALFEEQPYNPTDIATYQACYGTSATVTNVNVNGGPAPDPSDGESALDIEIVIGMAPKANILVYQGPSTAPAAILGAIVSANQAKVISSSYGVCESLTGAATINAESTILQEGAAQGQSFFISSGDSGSAMCFQATSRQPQPNTALSVIDPGGQPFATGVGGTFVFTGSDAAPNYYTPGDPLVEAVWNEGYSSQSGRASGTGGGISSFFTMPGYQSSAPAALGVVNADSSTQPCGGTVDCREVPDVAADADPNTGYAVYSSDNNGTANWGVTGGTSASAPLWASFVALANASATCRGLPIGFANPSLYQIAASSYNNNFNDVTHLNPLFYNQGNNGVTQARANGNDALGINGDKYQLRVGYDLATGLGSMIAPTLASSLCSARAPVYSVSVASPGNQAGIVGHAVSLQVAAADSGGQALSYSAAGLPAGLSMSQAGLITGTPTTAQTTTVTVRASDQFTNAGSTSFTWAVTNPPPPPPKKVGKPSANGAKISGLGKRKPKLSFTLTAGSNAPALKALAITLPSGLSFAKRAKSLTKGISLKGGKKKLKFTGKVKKGVLTLALKSSTRSVTLTIASPAVTITKAEASKIKKHKVKKLAFKLKTTNASKKTSTLTITFEKLS